MHIPAPIGRELGSLYLYPDITGTGAQAKLHQAALLDLRQAALTHGHRLDDESWPLKQSNATQLIKPLLEALLGRGKIEIGRAHV